MGLIFLTRSLTRAVTFGNPYLLMKIKLSEIPENGTSYEFTRKTAELNAPLEDLIGAADYHIQFHIKPLNTKDFTLSGTVVTKTQEMCSRCGDQFPLDINKKISEILIPKPEEDRTGKYAKTTVAISDKDLEIAVLEYTQNQFDLGDYLHEAIAIDIPFNPKPKTKPNGDCSLCDKPANPDNIIYDENLSVEKKNPFQSLKNLKLN